MNPNPDYPKLDDSVRRALLSLSHDAAGQILLDFLKRRVEAQSRLNDYQSDEVQLRIGQGRNQLARELLDGVEMARNQLNAPK